MAVAGTMTRVLLIDDDVELSAMLREYLLEEGFDTTTVHDGEAGLSEALSGRHAIVVLDVMLPPGWAASRSCAASACAATFRC